MKEPRLSEEERVPILRAFAKLDMFLPELLAYKMMEKYPGSHNNSHLIIVARRKKLVIQGEQVEIEGIVRAVWQNPYISISEWFKVWVDFSRKEGDSTLPP
ncbi:MAG: hypothetical protein ABH833_03825 [Parcubacteria group bacterium]